jgi:hypothetical protein
MVKDKDAVSTVQADIASLNLDKKVRKKSGNHND